MASAEAEVAMALAEVLDTNVESESELVGRREAMRHRLYEEGPARLASGRSNQ